MQHRGQIFSIDFLLSIILVVLFFGLIIISGEIKTNNTKESIDFDILKNKIDTASILLTNGKYSCESENFILANSLDLNKLIDKNELKTYLGLIDKNINLKIDNTSTILNDNLTKEKIINIEKNVLICNGLILFADLNNCLSGINCNLEKKKIVLGAEK